MKFEPIDIVGVVASEVGQPRADGSAGSGLYPVPIALSRSLSHEEGVLLTKLWDNPPEFSTMHRPGIARVAGDQFILSRTTIDEVASCHNKTLRLVVNAFNEQMPKVLDARAQDEARKQAEATQHRLHVADVASQIEF